MLTCYMLIYIFGSVAQWLERVSYNHEVGEFNPPQDYHINKKGIIA